MLYDFLKIHREEITKLCKEKVSNDSESKPTSMLLDKGLPIFYDELIGVLERTATANENDIQSKVFQKTNRIKKGDAATHGRESLRLGYSISQVVHSYGAICQSITEFVQLKSFKMKPREFRDLNYSLDCAIAEAVTEFETEQTKQINKNEIERLGFLVHEMKNSIMAASVSYEMINKGRVGSAGATSQVLTLSLERMKKLMAGVEKEIRSGKNAEIEYTRFSLINLIEEVENNARITEKTKMVNFRHDIDPSIQLIADRDMVFTVLLNLLNNAKKFTKKPGNVWVRSEVFKERILIEVEDECGGLPNENTEEMFETFSQKHSNKTGLGLGLSLSRQAIELNQGTLTARNIPGKGCVFTIDLPK